MKPKQNQRFNWIIGLVLLIFILSACSPSKPPVEIVPSNPPPATVEPSQTPLPSATAEPLPSPTSQGISANTATFRANPQRTGIYAEEGNYGEWSYFAGAPVAGSPVLAGDTLYFATMRGTVFALDPQNQQVRWQYQLPVAAFSTPAVADGVVYFADLAGNLAALDAKSGQEKWKIELGSSFVSSPYVENGVLYIGSIDGVMHSLDASNGKTIWQYQTQKSINSSPIVADGSLVFGSDDGFLYSLAADSGKLNWMYLGNAGILSSPSIVDGTVFIGSESMDVSGHAVDLKTGKPVWKDKAGFMLSSPVTLDGVVYRANLQGELSAANTKDGSLVWSFNAGAPIISSPSVSDDQIIFGDMLGKVHALDRQTGTEQWSFETRGQVWASPAVAGDTVFITSADGYLYALDRQAPQLALAPTPTSIPIEPTPTLLPEEPAPTETGTDNLAWWNDRVFYEVFVRSFQDSNGDGNGDLQGLIDRLDYLNDGDPNTTTDLGITGLWLMPVTESPSYHGYDVIDYRKIEEDYGTNADFQKLVQEAHKRGIAVIVDMVMNHTSNFNPWFQEAAFPGSNTENWYIWSPTKPDYKSPWGSEVWYQPEDFALENLRAYHTLTDYYYALFWSGMPDLNYRNGAVTNEMFDILKFWLTDMSVDGFRLDAVRHLIEDGEVQANTPETHAWLKNFDNFVHTVNPNAMTVGEIWDETVNVAPYVPDEVDLAFEFKLGEAFIESINTGDNTRLNTQTQTVLDTYPEGQFAPFLTNHDMDRVMSQLGNSPEKAKLAATLLLSYPGVPFIYYGEEIGLTGVRPEDVNVRTPMQWDGTETAGFTSAQPWLPLESSGETANVAAQTGDLESLLSRYRDMISLRMQSPALRAGDTWVVQTDQPQVFGLLRYSQGEAVLLVANLSDQPVKDYQLTLDSSALKGRPKASLLLGEGQPVAPRIDSKGGFQDFTPLPELAPYEAVLIQLK